MTNVKTVPVTGAVHNVYVTPDGKFGYIAAAGDNSITIVDVKTIKVVGHIPVGQAPKRNGPATMFVQ